MDEVKALGIKQVKLSVNEITVGMFISGLDRPWNQTPFPLQGFYIRESEEIQELKQHCRHVYIDVIKGNAPLDTRLKTLSGAPPAASKDYRTPPLTKQPAVAPIKVRASVYPTTVVPIAKELEQAKALHRDVYGALASVLKQLEGSGHHSVSVGATKRTAGMMVDSVLRSPDAFTWLSRVRAKDEYTYSHAVRSAVWGILFGRHIGLSKADLDVLALGILLKDIGKTRLPKHVLEASARNRTEQQVFEKFVDYGIEILRKMPDIPPRVTSVIKTHRERINGSGFPEHLRGDRIPLLGKIAGIVTFYDEIVNPRGQAHPLPPSKAVAKLYELRDIEFQADLVVEFIRAVGLYPTGTLVELNTGEVAVVVEQNFQRRLKPKVMIVMDAYKQPLLTPIMLDMAEDDREKQARLESGRARAEDVERIEIVQDLEPGAFDVDITSIRDQYVERQGGRKFMSFLKGRKPLGSLFGS